MRIFLLQISLLVAGFDGIERLSVLNNPVCVSQNSLRAYIACTMPRLKFFNDISITEQERAPSPAGAPAPIPSAATESGRDRLETSALDDPQERSRDRERERKRDRDKEAETETFLGPRSGSAMCYPLRARDLDREEEDALPHSTASSTSPRPSSPPSHRQSYLNAGADAESLSQAASSSSIGTDADHSNPEEAERIFKAMVLTYFRQVIHETVESLCPI